MCFPLSPPFSWWTPTRPLDLCSNIASPGKPLLTPDEARFSPSRGCAGRAGTKGSKTKVWGDDLMISFPFIYTEGLGLEFRVSAYVCFCTSSEIEIDFYMFFAGHLPVPSLS